MTTPHIYDTPNLKCPTCSYQFERTICAPGTPGANDRPPANGDVSVCVRCTALLRFDKSDDGEISLRVMTSAELLAISPNDRRALDVFAELIRKSMPQSNMDVLKLRADVAIARLPFSDAQIDCIAHVAYESERAYARLVNAADISAWPGYLELPASQQAEHRDVVRHLLATDQLPLTFLADDGRHRVWPGDCRMVFEVSVSGFAQVMSDVLARRPSLLFNAVAERLGAKIAHRHPTCVLVDDKGVMIPNQALGVVKPETAAELVRGGAIIIEDPELRDETLNLYKSHSLPVYDGPDGVLVVKKVEPQSAPASA